MKKEYVIDPIAEDLERAAKEAAPLTLEERVEKLERDVGRLKRAILKSVNLCKRREERLRATKQINPKRTT
jgi:hypothetical protein